MHGAMWKSYPDGRLQLVHLEVYLLQMMTNSSLALTEECSFHWKPSYERSNFRPLQLQWHKNRRLWARTWSKNADFGSFYNVSFHPSISAGSPRRSKSAPGQSKVDLDRVRLERNALDTRVFNSCAPFTAKHVLWIIMSLWLKWKVKEKT